MPLLLPNGHVLTGKGWGLGLVRIDSVTPLPLQDKMCGGWVFVDRDTIAGPYADGNGPVIVGEIRLDDLSRFSNPERYRHAVNEAYGGGGKLVTYGEDNIRGSWHKDDCGCYDVSDDGDAIFNPGRDGQALEIVRADGQVTHEAVTGMRGASFSQGRLLICDAGGSFVVGLADGSINSVPTVADGRPGVLVGEHLVWGSDFGLAIRRDNSTMGLVVGTGNNYRPDARVLADGLIQIVTSPNEDESGATRVYLVDLEQEMVKDGAEPWRPAQETDFSGGTTPPIPVPEPGPTEHVCVAALPNKFWIRAYHTHTGQFLPKLPHGLPDWSRAELVGNCAIVTGWQKPDKTLDVASLREQLEVAYSQGIRMITVPDPICADERFVDRTVGYWCAGGSLAEVAEQVAITTALPEKALYTYLDNRDWPIEPPSFISPNVIVDVQCYIGQHESLAEFDAAMRVVLDAVKGYGCSMALTVAAYDRTWGQAFVDKALQTFPIIRRWCDEYPVVALHFFSDHRQGGMRDYPQYREWLEAFMRANPARTPDRGDHWGTTSPARLLNKLSQSTALIAYTAAEKAYLRDTLTGAPTDPRPDPDPPTPPDPGIPQPNPGNWQDRLDVALYVDARHPHLLQRVRDEKDEELRGPYVDQLAHELNRRDRTDRWGRKARQEGDVHSLNDDALTYRLDDADLSKKKLIDCVNGLIWENGEPTSEGADPSWTVRPAHEEPGNGFWHPPVNPDLGRETTWTGTNSPRRSS